jgi:hypothetical protein
MEQASNPKPPGSCNERRRGSTRSKLSIDEVRNVKLAAPPGGGDFLLDDGSRKASPISDSRKGPAFCSLARP